MNPHLNINKIGLTLLLLLFVITGLAQKPLNVFRWFGYADVDSFRLTRPLRFYEILCSKTGQHKFTSSFGLIRDKGMQIEIIFYTWGDDKTKKLSRNYAGRQGSYLCMKARVI